MLYIWLIKPSSKFGTGNPDVKIINQDIYPLNLHEYFMRPLFVNQNILKFALQNLSPFVGVSSNFVKYEYQQILLKWPRKPIFFLIAISQNTKYLKDNWPKVLSNRIIKILVSINPLSLKSTKIYGAAVQQIEQQSSKQKAHTLTLRSFKVQVYNTRINHTSFAFVDTCMYTT